MNLRIFVVAAIAGALGGCATVTRGTTDQITVNSIPSEAEARTSLGHACPATPCTWEVSRKAEFTVSFSKPGYEAMQIPVATRVAGAGVAGFAGNVVIGGLIGMGVDAATGSTLEHYPSPVIATLIPLHKSGAAGRSDKRRGVSSHRREVDRPRPKEEPPVT
ncbi:translation initiation factor 2 [Bosea vaviloviae]|uniref:Translation initiation factor 2 n=1 Tax=Bosea vaviloviae TaxID=1526658 RepID=A0A1D7U3I1_9HYPH|nr:translation initiation factor 2 [Bosea vaviloviae]